MEMGETERYPSSYMVGISPVCLIRKRNHMNALELNESGQIVRGRWWALVALAFCLLVITLDMTVLNVALPTLARDLQAAESQLQWMVDAYTLVYASLVLLGGSL